MTLSIIVEHTMDIILSITAVTIVVLLAIAVVIAIYDQWHTPHDGGGLGGGLGGVS